MKLSTLINTTVLSTVLGTTLALSGTAMAQTQSTDDIHKAEEKRALTGVLGGAAAGALAGGPPGAIVGVLLGAFLSDSINNEKGRELAQTDLRKMELDYSSLQRENNAMQLALQEMREARVQQVALIQEQQQSGFSNTELVLHFKTNSNQIESHYNDDLENFSRMIKDNPDTLIQITGYADQRGENRANLQLSRSRVQAVEQALKSQGLNDVPMQSVAYGASRPVASDQHPESLFYDRRVVIKARPRTSEYLGRVSD